MKERFSMGKWKLLNSHLQLISIFPPPLKQLQLFPIFTDNKTLNFFIVSSFFGGNFSRTFPL